MSGMDKNMPDTTPDLPMDRDRAMGMADEDGFVTVVLDVEIEDLMQASNAGAVDGERDEHDLIHELAFGVDSCANNCQWRALGAWSDPGDCSPGTMRVEYTTNIIDGAIDDDGAFD